MSTVYIEKKESWDVSSLEKWMETTQIHPSNKNQAHEVVTDFCSKGIQSTCEGRY